MAKPQLTEYQKFERKMKNLEPGVRYTYWSGQDLSYTRQFRPELDRIARFVRAVYDLGYGQLFQVRDRNKPTTFNYVVVLHQKLGMRKDGTGRFQEAERVSCY